MTDRVRPPEKRYLGDGVYVAPGSCLGELILTTEDGISVQNTIVLDPSIVQGIARFMDHVVTYAKQLQDDEAKGQAPLSPAEEQTLRGHLAETRAKKDGPA